MVSELLFSIQLWGWVFAELCLEEEQEIKKTNKKECTRKRFIKADDNVFRIECTRRRGEMKVPDNDL